MVVWQTHRTFWPSARCVFQFLVVRQEAEGYFERVDDIIGGVNSLCGVEGFSSLWRDSRAQEEVQDSLRKAAQRFAPHET